MNFEGNGKYIIFLISWENWKVNNHVGPVAFVKYIRCR